MMKIKTSKLKGLALDWAVGKAVDHPLISKMKGESA